MRITCLFFSLISIFFLSSCGVNVNYTETTHDYTDINQTDPFVLKPKNKSHQVLLGTELKQDFISLKEGEILDLTEVGLKDVLVYKKVRTTQFLDDEQQKLFSYILSDFCCYGEQSNVHDSYVAVETGKNVLFYDLKNASYEDSLYSCDLDGDGLDEIIIHQMVGMSGGAGQFVSRILKISDNKLCEMFNSRLCVLNDDNKMEFDTGFNSEFLEGKKLRIFNTITGYNTIIDISPKYTNEFFDEKGKGILSFTLECDAFYEFAPKDVDGDGIFEIQGMQYAFLGSHADGIGNAKSILKFNQNTKKFEIVQSDFFQ